MVVAPLALDRLDDEGRDVVFSLPKGGLDLGDRLILEGFHPFQDGFRHRERELRTGDSGPVEFREVLRLSRIGRVRQGERVPGAAVERVPEMEDLVPLLLPKTLREVFPDLPVKGRLESVLDGDGAPFDEEKVARVGVRDREPGKRLDEIRVRLRVDVAVGGLVRRDIGETLPKLDRAEFRMIVADRAGRKVREEVEDEALAPGVVEVRAATAGE